MENFSKREAVLGGESTINILTRAVWSLDFPVLLIDSTGKIQSASESAQSLIPQLGNLSGGISLMDILVTPPADIKEWLSAQQEISNIQFKQGNGGISYPLIVTLRKLELAPETEPFWLLNLHEKDDISRQKYEREILLRISSVPIPDMRDEGQAITLANPGHCRVTRNMLGEIARYIDGTCVMVLHLARFQSLSLVGLYGLEGDELKSFLGNLENPETPVSLYDGCLIAAANLGFSNTFSSVDSFEPVLKKLVGFLPFECTEIWVEGVGGFGAVITFFSQPPNHGVRQFATDAFVRLGRHLESATYSNNMYEAYLELQDTQEQMIQSSKMAAIGELATGMAHELRQPVTVINNFFTTIFDHLENGRFDRIQAKLEEYKSRFGRNIERLTGIIDHLRNFGRQDSIRYDKTDIRVFLDEIFSTFLQSQLENGGIKIVFNIPEDCPKVELDSPRIEQVVLNLVTNARDALENTENPEIQISVQVQPPNIHLSVSDNGPGIQEGNYDKVLNPFFTTKPVGKGTGVGLSVSHGIIKSHNGELIIDREREIGAKFTMVLPLEQTRAPKP